MNTKKDQHVVPSGGKWAVRSTGADRSSKVFPSKDLAVKYAREIARNTQTGLYVHGKDGLVTSKATYAPTSAVVKNLTGAHLQIVRTGPKTFAVKPAESDGVSKGKK